MAADNAGDKENRMGRIVMSGPRNVSLDGVVQDPDGQEGFSLGGWFNEFGCEDLEEWAKVALDEALGAEAWLLGRRSYEFFGARWRRRSGALADRLNSIPKYVVSSTLEDPDWNNTTVPMGDVVTEVTKLKQELDGEIVVPASYQLGRTLIEHDLVDELRLVVFPVVPNRPVRRTLSPPMAPAVTRPRLRPSRPAFRSAEPSWRSRAQSAAAGRRDRGARQPLGRDGRPRGQRVLRLRRGPAQVNGRVHPRHGRDGRLVKGHLRRRFGGLDRAWSTPR
jgi:dihydrofolate reductase